MADASKAPAAETDDAPAREGRMSWVVGWVIIPGVFAGGIVLAGALVGAHYPDMWFTRFVEWLAG